MTGRRRFIKSIIATAKSDETQMPWTRGTARREMIARRTTKDAQPNRKTASA